MKLDRGSPWYIVWVAVSSAVVVGLITWLFDGDWWYALIIVVAIVIGAIIGNVLRSRRD